MAEPAKSSEYVAPLTDDERDGLLHLAQELRALARKVEQEKVTLDEAIYEQLRLDIAFYLLPLLRRVL